LGNNSVYRENAFVNQMQMPQSCRPSTVQVKDIVVALGRPTSMGVSWFLSLCPWGYHLWKIRWSLPLEIMVERQILVSLGHHHHYIVSNFYKTLKLKSCQLVCIVKRLGNFQAYIWRALYIFNIAPKTKEGYFAYYSLRVGVILHLI